MLFYIIKIFVLAVLAFIITVLWTPILTHFLYKYNFGKKIRDEKNAPIFYKFHKDKAGTPTMGGILIWGTVFFISVTIFCLYKFTGLEIFKNLNFLSRGQTLLPLGALIASAIIGCVDDFFNIRKIGSNGGGLKVRHKLILYTIIACFGAWWFFFKLGWDIIDIPFLGSYHIGILYIPLFIFIISATSFSVNETDGLDGLAGGVLLTSFAAYAVIAFVQEKFDLAVFCAVISGSLAAFLWFNVYPARFFMGDTGSMSLGTTLGIVAMLTNTFLILPIIGFILVFESFSVIVQTISKRFRKKKIFLSTPIHHHFQAIGWPEPKIVLRAWLISGIMAIIGLIVFLLDRFL
ncbi:phospho-N-acetylmuramoyl-pentapeptide-transferase [Patescibacteria group bacterium]|nr:phospho-N-acetylmuramoyl-pentapeptide-transferase [Patescibacteria group bacterium]